MSLVVLKKSCGLEQTPEHWDTPVRTAECCPCPPTAHRPPPRHAQQDWGQNRSLCFQNLFLKTIHIKYRTHIRLLVSILFARMTHCLQHTEP